MSKWKLSNNGSDYLTEKLDEQITAYVNYNDFYNLTIGQGNSLKEGTQSKFRYTDFLERMYIKEVGFTMKESESYEKLK